MTQPPRDISAELGADFDPSAPEWTVEVWEDENGRSPFASWFDRLEEQDQAIVDAVLTRVVATLGIGVCSTEWGKALGDGLYEVRMRCSLNAILNRGRSTELEPLQMAGGDRTVLLRLFCTFHGNKVVLLFQGYDKRKPCRTGRGTSSSAYTAVRREEAALLRVRGGRVSQLSLRVMSAGNGYARSRQAARHTRLDSLGRGRQPESGRVVSAEWHGRGMNRLETPRNRGKSTILVNDQLLRRMTVLSTEEVAVEAIGLVIRFGSRVVFDDVSFALPSCRQAVAPLGPSGAGKNTAVELVWHAVVGSALAEEPTAATHLAIVVARRAHTGRKQSAWPGLDLCPRMV
ncbi:hypothetical protein [Xylanimonas ulmi]|uniref:hypothetical protein n=1 Tax=Xylanimonas ulmi TaxID=228973 RepID=UPI00102AC81D|nr:hypothetical protein [Xylanibacterium ulmi]